MGLGSSFYLFSWPPTLMMIANCRQGSLLLSIYKNYICTHWGLHTRTHTHTLEDRRTNRQRAEQACRVRFNCVHNLSIIGANAYRAADRRVARQLAVGQLCPRPLPPWNVRWKFISSLNFQQTTAVLCFPFRVFRCEFSCFPRFEASLGLEFKLGKYN